MVASQSLRPIEVLLLDDDPEDLRLVRQALPEPGFHVRHGAANGGQPPDVVVIDLAADVPDVGVLPIVALTEPGDPEPELSALDRGALDHVAKDELGTSALPRAIRYVLERHRLEDELRRLAHIDPLTGVYNRRYLTKALDAAVAAARRHGHPVTIVVCDLDDFKATNDRWGHLAGDAVLQAVADALSHHVRTEDTVARFGGDEFCIVMPHVDAAAAAAAVQRMRQRLAALRVEIPGAALSVSATFGLAELDESHGSGRDLFEAADQALYRGKAQHDRRPA